MTHLGKQNVSEYCACANKHEEHEVEQEYCEGSYLEHQAFIVVRKVVQKGRDDASAHDHGMPGPSEVAAYPCQQCVPIFQTI